MSQISILIPVYNAASRLQDLLDTVTLNTTSELVSEIIIGDDCSDLMTKSVIQHAMQQEKFNVKTITHKENIGYLKNANSLFATAKGEIVVCLNTDTMVPPFWLERIIAAFASDQKIALATPFSTNAENLVVLPSDGQSWLDVDQGLQTLIPEYPNALKAIGFALCIRKNCLADQPLFDEIYAPGYWEETDLHYRMLHKGYRSIVIDNLLIYHAHGSSSFSQTHDLPAIDTRNKKIFFQRWGKEYKACEKIFKQTQPYAHLRFNQVHFGYLAQKQTIDVLFVLPSFLPGYGGTSVVIKLINWLNINKIRTSLFVFDFVDNAYADQLGLINPWRSIADIKRNVHRIKIVFATGSETVSKARGIAESYHASLAYFVQGPELLFRSGVFFSDILQDYKTINHIYCISSFLSEYLQQLGLEKPTYLPLGPDPLFFYPDKKMQRDNRSIAGCLRHEPGKGTGLMLYNCYLAKQAGFKIHLFGKDSQAYHIPEDFATCHGNLSPVQLRQLFSQVGFYLDNSYFEGLGLLPLEAAYCGAIPILNHKGGTRNILFDHQNAFYLPDGFVTVDYFKEIAAIDEATCETIRNAGRELANKFSSRLAHKDFLFELKKLPALSKTNKTIVNETWSKISLPLYNRARSFLKRMVHSIVRLRARDVLLRFDKIQDELAEQSLKIDSILKKMPKNYETY
jgi:GT2 family glycosyltransferase